MMATSRNDMQIEIDSLSLFPFLSNSEKLGLSELFAHTDMEVMTMKKFYKGLLAGGAIAAVSAAAGALLYKRYMDDFYEYITDEATAYDNDDVQMTDETGVTEDDFETVENHETGVSER